MSTITSTCDELKGLAAAQKWVLIKNDNLSVIKGSQNLLDIALASWNIPIEKYSYMENTLGPVVDILTPDPLSIYEISLTSLNADEEAKFIAVMVEYPTTVTTHADKWIEYTFASDPLSKHPISGLLFQTGTSTQPLESITLYNSLLDASVTIKILIAY